MPYRMKSKPPADWETAHTLGRLSSDVEHLRGDVTELDRHREKHKAEIDKLRTWAERAFFLVALAMAAAGGHATAPMVGSLIGSLLRGLAGLRPG